MPQIHLTADVQTRQIGNNTQIWQFVVILPKAKIGDDCNINAHFLIENDVVIVGPNVTFTNDRYPRSKAYSEEFLNTTVCKGASIGGGRSHSAWNDDRSVRHGGGSCNARCSDGCKGHWQSSTNSCPYERQS